MSNSSRLRHCGLSEAQAELQPIIDKFYNEAEANQESRTDKTCENLNALRRALDSIDVNCFDQRTHKVAEVLKKIRPAKLLAIEILYEFAKDISKRELTNFVFYLTMVRRGIAEILLSGWMGSGYLLALWPALACCVGQADALWRSRVR
jgi:hypothetical protein